MSSIEFVKRRIIISMSAIVLLILTLVGITYAYFTANIRGNENKTSVSVTAGSLALEYDGKNSYVNVTKLKPGENIGSKEFSVTNTGKNTVENYDVILENVVNELEKYEDLTYTLVCTSSKGNECNGSNGVFPRSQEVIVTNTIEPEEVQLYILTLTYHETNKDQSVDMNKSISARVNIKDDVSNIKKLNIYGNSIQDTLTYGDSTPDNPVEIVSLGEKTNNLLVYPFKDKSKSASGITYTDNNDGGIIVNGTSTGYPMFQLITQSSDKWPLKIGKNYILSVNLPGVDYFIYYKDKDGKTQYVKSVTWSDEYTEGIIYLQINPGNSVDGIVYPMLQEGNTVTDYEPIGYKVPVEVTGRNLIDYKTVVGRTDTEVKLINNGFNIKGKYAGIIKNIKVKPNTDYYFSYDSINITENVKSVKIFPNSTTSISIIDLRSNNGGTFNTGEYDNIQIWFYASYGNAGEREITNVQLIEGTEPLEYEPYKNKIHNIYLNEPLRKLGDYADYIDYENKKVVRNIREMIFDGTSVGINTLSQSNNIYYGVVNIDDHKSIGETKHTAIKSNYFDTTYGVSLGATYLENAIRLVMVNTDQSLNTKELWNEWLKGKYDNNNPVKIYYQLKNPIEETIDLPILNINDSSNLSVCSDNGVCASNIEVEFDS